jgi:hypothetical protein
MQGNNNIKQVATKLNDLNGQSQLCRKVFAPTSGIFLGGTEPKKASSLVLICAMVKTSDWESKHNGNPHENGLILGNRPMCGPTILCILILVDSTWLVVDTAN